MSCLAFGPVNSRRLGLSLGVNNIPYKHCTYSCIYCQLGRTRKLTIKRRRFYEPDEVARSVINILSQSVKVDYITFVPDGEPTLDSNLGLEIKMLRKKTNKPIAVLTNSSLLWMETVKNNLRKADLISIKIDAASEELWRKINRPHKSLKLDKIIDGIIDFSRNYKGTLITETMLIKGLNDKPEDLELIAKVIAKVKPKIAYISIPVRPPAEKWVKPPSEESLLIAYETFSEKAKIKVELLTSIELPPLTASNPIEYILATTSVHPLKLEYAIKLLEEKGLDPHQILRQLEDKGLIKIIEHEGCAFIMRRL